MVCCAAFAAADDSTVTPSSLPEGEETVTSPDLPEGERTLSKYEENLLRKERIWASLIPTNFVIQNAGNMGTLSAGIGWSYGRQRQWETDLLIGFIPKHDSSRTKVTTTLKGNFIPWRINLTPNADMNTKGRWSFEPLTASLYLNTVYGSEFWKSQPGRYPDKYYQFMSTKFRLNVAFGERLTFYIPKAKQRRHNRISLFYEIGSSDLYIRSLFQGQDVSIGDILGLSIGLKFYTL
jgi:hypothetical protein